MTKLFRILRDFLRMLSSPFDRLELMRSYVRLLFSPGSVSKILGFRVHFMDLASLRSLFEDLFIGRLYDIDLQAQDPVIVDCGSNIGMSILFFKSRYPNARIIGFEPHPETFELLQKNVDTNHLRDTEVYPIALSATSEQVKLFFNDTDPSTQSLNMSMTCRGHDNHVTVKAERLSALLPDRVDILKLDIEGAEDEVLFDLAEQNQLGRIRHIVCEYHHHIAGEDKLGKLLSRLEAEGFGYQISGYVNRPVELGRYQDLMIYAYNKKPAQPNSQTHM